MVLSLLLLVSRGWQITRPNLDINELRHHSFMVISYVFVWLLYQLFGGLILLFLLVLVYVLILRYLFASVSWRLRLLSTFGAYMSALLHPHQSNTDSSDLHYQSQSTAAGEEQPIIAAAGLPVRDYSHHTAPVAGSGGNNVPLPYQPVADGYTMVDLPSRTPERTAPAPSSAVDHQQQVTIQSPEDASLIMPDGQGTGGWCGGACSRLTSRTYSLIGNPALVPEGTLTARQIRALRGFRAAVVTYILLDITVRTC
jgi:hypothetical protein